MTRTGHSGARRLASVLCLCLATALALLSAAAPTVAADPQPTDLAVDWVDTGLAVVDCHGSGDGEGVDCPATNHHCAACLVAVVLHYGPNPTGTPQLSPPCPRPIISLALNRPDVPRAPPRLT